MKRPVVYRMSQRRYEVLKTGVTEVVGHKPKGWELGGKFKPMSDNQIIKYLNDHFRCYPPIEKIAVEN